MTRTPRPDGKIVEAANLPTRFQAEVAIQVLETNGVQATGKFGDVGGWMPHVALVDGYRVLVFEEDLETAKALLEAEDLYEDGEPIPDDQIFEETGVEEPSLD